MSVLVIGAAGFVGSHLAKVLISSGYRVCGIDTNAERAKAVLPSGVSFHCCDFAMQLSVADILRRENVDTVIQCAGNIPVERSVATPIDCSTNNAVGNLFFLDVLLKNFVGKFAYVSSASVFGEVDRMPITEQTVRLPISPLGNSQLFVENTLESLRISNGLTYAILRASNVTGLSDVENEYFVKNVGTGLIPTILDQIIGKIDAVPIFGTSYDTLDRTPERDYIHVDDFCSACVNVLSKLAVRGEGMAYNIGSGRKYSVKEVIAEAEKIFGVKISTKDFPSRVGDPSRSYFDISKARNELDWSPKYESIDKILKTFLPHYTGKQKERPPRSHYAL
jgi:UDP-glucose 4-epimerase